MALPEPGVAADLTPPTLNDDIRGFVDELAADPDVRGVGLFGSYARGTAGPDSDADLVVLVDHPGFVMECAVRGDQEFELVRLSEATAIAYFTDNPDHAADVWPTFKILHDPGGGLARVRDVARALVAQGKPALDEARVEWSRFASADRLRAAARLAETDLTTAQMVLNERLLELTATYFDLRRQWTPPMKRRMPAIADQDPELHALVVGFFGNAGSFDEQLGLAGQVLEAVYAGHAG
jgi:hypothetical protein